MGIKQLLWSKDITKLLILVGLAFMLMAIQSEVQEEEAVWRVHV